MFAVLPKNRTKSIKFRDLIIKNSISGGRVVLQLVVGERHAGVVVVGAADHELARVLVQRELVEPHRTHEGNVGCLMKKIILRT